MKKLMILAFLFSTCIDAQDFDWVREWESVQRHRPASIPSTARIAPASEPGPPLVVHGRVLDAALKPVPNVVVFAYQTDRTGVYNREGERGWRLRGWARSDAAGRFELHTIRPGSYPGSANPAHIHVTIDGPGLPRRWTHEIQFADDSLVSDKVRQRALPVEVRGGVQYVHYTITISEEGRF